VACAAGTPFAGHNPPPETVAVQLRDAAMAGHDIAYTWVSELTTRFGPRPAGSANEQAAAEWAAARLKDLGFDNVHIESFPITAWVRGTESAQLISPSVQPLTVAALGESPPTPAAGLEGDVMIFPTLEELKAAPAGALTGKIAMVTMRMVRRAGRWRLRAGRGGAGRRPARSRAARRDRVPDAFRRHRQSSQRPHRYDALRGRQGRGARVCLK
jgi:hypothetical protein